MKSSELFELPISLSHFENFFKSDASPWQWVSNIKDALKSLDFSNIDSKSNIPQGVYIEGKVFIHPSVKLPHFASIVGPAWIGAHTEIRPGAFVRGNVIVGEHCVLGNSCEYKNCLLLDRVQTPHYNYVGDSILGNKSHIGAGVILANLRLDKSNVLVQTDHGRVDSGLRKLGAILGDEAEAGCNAVLQPGTILKKRAVVMSGLAYAGTLEENTILFEKPVYKKIPRLF